MTKQENIFNLYDKLDKNGSKGDALSFISETIGAKKSTIKSHWFYNREFPEYVTEKHLDLIIDYLQKAIANQNIKVSA